MRSNLRWAQLSDFDCCARLSIAGMKTTIEELNLNLDAQLLAFANAEHRATALLI